MWNVLNDPLQDFDVNKDVPGLLGLCLVFWATIVFSNANGERKQWSVTGIVSGEESMQKIFMSHQDGILKVYTLEEFDRQFAQLRIYIYGSPLHVFNILLFLPNNGSLRFLIAHALNTSNRLAA
jgi:hypothetical protein